MKPRLQFSLGALLSSVVALGAVLGLFFASREISKLRAENAEMRGKLGRLEISDSSKIYICRIIPNYAFAGPFDPEQWVYRVYVPKGNYRFGYQRDEVSPAGIDRLHAEYANFGELDGEFDLLIAHHLDNDMTSDLEFRIRPQPTHGLSAMQGKGSSVVLNRKEGFEPVYFKFELMSFPDRPGPIDVEEATSFMATTTVLLIALKCPLNAADANGQKTLKPTDKPGPGLLVWLERDPGDEP